MADPITLYKLIVLYMLKKIDFSMTNAQISNFILDQGYTTYFTLQSVLAELTEAGLIHQETIQNTSFYTITPEGEETIGFFGNKISRSIRDDVDKYLKENNIQILTAQLQDSELYYDTDMKRGTAIVMGTEATGLTDIWRKAADAHIRIPMLGITDSLNVSVSAAILLYEAVRQREA